MFTILAIVIILICILVIGIVLIQNPKGGIMSSSFGSVGNQIIGASKSTDVVEKITWYLGGGMMVLCLLSVFILPTSKQLEKENKAKSEIEEAIKNSKSSNTPVLPTNTTPVNGATPPPPPALQQGGQAK